MYSEVITVLDSQLCSAGAGSEDLPLCAIAKREKEWQALYAGIICFISLSQKLNAQLHTATTLFR